MQWLYDTHIHLSDPAYQKDLQTTIRNMEHMHTKACCVGMDPADSEETLRISRQSDLLMPFIGIHPEKASADIDAMEKMIEKNIDELYGIGEIGLDPAYCATDADTKRQQDVFERLLALAEKYDKPVSIHSRKSVDEVLLTLKSFSVKNACLHWFDGNKKQLAQTMEMNLFVSYGPVMVYADDKKSLLKRTDPERILVETDGPVKFSRCFRFKQAQPSFIPSVIFAASKVLKKSYDEMCLLLEANSARFLGV